MISETLDVQPHAMDLAYQISDMPINGGKVYIVVSQSGSDLSSRNAPVKGILGSLRHALDRKA